MCFKKSSQVTADNALNPDDKVLSEALKTQVTNKPGTPLKSLKVSITKYGISWKKRNLLSMVVVSVKPNLVTVSNLITFEGITISVIGEHTDSAETSQTDHQNNTNKIQVESPAIFEFEKLGFKGLSITVLPPSCSWCCNIFALQSGLCSNCHTT